VNRSFRPPLAFILVGAVFLLSLYLLRKALIPFFLAIILAYLLAPLVKRLRRRLGNGLSVLTVIFGFLALIVTFLWTLVPWLWGQMARFTDSVPAWRQALQVRLTPWMSNHLLVRTKVEQAVGAFDPMLLVRSLEQAGSGVLSGILSLFTLILVPLILYYMLLEGRTLLAGMDGLVPPRYRAWVHAFATSVHERLGGYIRGQLSVALVMSALHGIGLLIMGIPYAGMLGLVAGVSNFIPYSPYVTALPIALFLAGVGGAGWGKILLIGLVFTIIQKAETLYFTPVWVGRATKLHPLEVLLALLSFGFAFGLLGLVFAVPIMIVVKVAAELFLGEYRNHPWFTGTGEES
jgi:predicted PurR-regulated permease PerM